jgi:hypothetical protein
MPAAPSRRTLLTAAGIVAASPLASSLAWAQPAAPAGPPAGGPPAGGAPGRPPPPPPTAAEIAAALPLKTTGLEHVSTLVPDVAVAGLFFGKVFNPELHKEKAPPLRYYVPLKVGYIAIGAAGQRPTQIDHYCALVEDYKPAAVTERLKQEGVASAARFGMMPDVDGLQLQLLGTPGGLAASTEPAGRIAPEAPIVQPIALNNIILSVADVDASLAFHRKFYTGKVTREGAVTWIQIADTRLGIVKAAAGEKPKIESFCVNVAKFDRAAVARKLQALGATIGQAREKDSLRFTSPFGITVDIKGAA